MRDKESWGTLHRPAFEPLEPRLLLNGTINDPAQLVDECGGFGGFTPTGDARQSVFTVTVQAHNPVASLTVVTFSLNGADSSPAHDTLVFGNNFSIMDLGFGSGAVTVVPEPATLSFFGIGAFFACRRKRKKV